LWLWVKEISPLDFARMRSVFSSCQSPPSKGEFRRVSFCKKYKKSFEKVKTILSQNHFRLLSFPQYNRFDVPNTYGKSWTSRHFTDGRICGWKNTKTICIWAWNYSTDPMRASGHDVVGPLRHGLMNLKF